MTDVVRIELARDEALVLFAMFWRFHETDSLELKFNAEDLALTRIAAQLDKTLVEPFQADYDVRLREARERVAAGYEGLAPGVKPEIL